MEKQDKDYGFIGADGRMYSTLKELDEANRRYWESRKIDTRDRKQLVNLNPIPFKYILDYIVPDNKRLDFVRERKK